MELFKNITRKDLLKAIQKIRQEGIPPGVQSTGYDVLYEEERFPPKLVVSYAYRFVNRKELDHRSLEVDWGQNVLSY